MFKKILILAFIAIFLISCQKGKEEAKNFSNDFTKTKTDLKIKEGKVKTRVEYVAFKEESKKQYESLLKKYEKSPNIEEIEILRCKVLLKLNKLDDAEKKIDNILKVNEKPELLAEAKMIKVQVLLEKGKYSDAYSIFKEIESQVKDVKEIFDAYYAFASQEEDYKVKEEYSNRILDSKQLPKDYADSRYEMYYNLAVIAKEEGNLEKAKKLLTDGIASTKDEGNIALVKKSLEQLDYYGKPAFPINTGIWVNSTPLKLEQLKGKVVVLFFWAPWCPSCRALTPFIVDIYEKMKNRDFALIAGTRLYGTYRDDVLNKGKVTKEEEIELTKKYIERKKLPYPIVIVDDKTVYAPYKIPGIPMVVFINKKGEITFTRIGSGGEKFIADRIEKLLAEK